MKELVSFSESRWIILAVLVLAPAIAFGQVNLTFTVDMEREYNLDGFNPAEDTVDVRGSFNDWGDSLIIMDRVNDSFIYTQTVEFSDEEIGDTIQFKFHAADWEGGPNRTYTLTGDENQNVPVATFNVPYSVFVHFRLDMEEEINETNFDPAVDTLVVRGDFPRLIDPELAEWGGTDFKLTPWDHDDYDHLYGISIQFPDAAVDSTIEFKFVIVPDDGDDIWESDPNHQYVIDNNEHQDLAVIPFDGQYGDPVTATVTFRVDMRAQIAGGIFNPDADDKVYVNGGFNNWTEVDEMFEDFELDGRYEVSVDIEWVPGQEIEYKYRMIAGDGRSMPNDGWEGRENRIIDFTGEDISLEYRFFDDITLDDILSRDVDITFRIDMNNATDVDDTTQIEFETLWIAGSTPPLFWIWDHMDDDRDHLELLDDNGDGIYEVTITIPEGQSRRIEYKYAIDLHGETLPSKPYAFGYQESDFAENRVIEIPPGTFSLIVDDPTWGEWDRDWEDIITNVDQIDSNVPYVFSLDQNYPNPFNPATTIQYSIPKAEKVVLTIYNVLGQQVATLVNEVQNPGTYQATFDAAHLASGVYIYRIQAGDFVESKRMMLIK